ncbi:MAG: acyl-CoA dehydrogenase family protein [Candidatus Rokubacteria bacterium]|nr:acyl-CoA dehydrogenase family protein [Candidatus Rokubacteria bacterium]
MTEDFGLEREHREFRDTFRRFVADKIAPIAERGEREQRFPREVYAVLRDAGFLAVNFPVEVGGGGGDLLMGCIFYEELTRASAGVSAGVFAHQHLAAGPVFHLGTEEQKQEFLLPALRGERLGAFGLTEPDAGSDIRGIKTTARRDGGDFVLNGSKLYITNGSIADFMLVAARTSQARSADALSMFIVETRDPGVTARDLVKVGNHSSSTAFVSLEDVRVPARRVLGEVGRGLAQLKATLTEGRILVANRGLGLAQEAWELILRYANERQAFGRTIGSFQGVAFKIAEMAARLDAVRLMIYRAARLKMAGHDCVREASMAKYLASEAAVRVTAEALLLHGGAGYMEEMKVARLYRDAPEAWIGEGTNEIQLSVIARSLGLL